jgi:hypothetical protein
LKKRRRRRRRKRKCDLEKGEAEGMSCCNGNEKVGRDLQMLKKELKRRRSAR